MAVILEQLRELKPHPNRENRPAWVIDASGNMILMTSQATLLNALLPDQYQLQHSVLVYPRPDYSKRVIVFDVFRLDNEYYRAALALAFGHVFMNEETALPDGENALIKELSAGDFHQRPVVERAALLIDWRNQQYNIDNDAYERARPIAGLLDVSEQIYQEVQFVGLVRYHVVITQIFRDILKHMCPDLEEITPLRLFNPFSKTHETVTYLDFKSDYGLSKLEQLAQAKERDFYGFVEISADY